MQNLEGGGRADTIADGLTKLFAEIKEKPKIADLTVEYQKFAEWLRIEYVPSSKAKKSS